MSTRLTSPKRVLSWWWSMLMMKLPPVGEEVDRHAVDVAAVEEDHGAVGHVGRRLVEDLLERQEAVLDRQRELLRRHEHHRVLAELGEQVVHAEQRAERVAVGALVGGEEEAVAVAQLGDDPLDLRAAAPAASLTRPPPRPRAAARSASPTRPSGRSGSSGSASASSASRRRSRDWITPCEERRPSSVASRCSSSPSTLTCTLAARRSGLVSTEVTVTKPMRGSLNSVAIAAPTTSRSTSLMRRMRGRGHPITPASARPAWSGRTRARRPP